MCSRQVGELEQRGLVCRRPDPSDRRACLVRLTPDGHAVLERARTLRHEWLRGALARCPADDVQAAARLVAALADELQAKAPELGPVAQPPPAPPRDPQRDRPTPAAPRGTNPS